MDDLDLIYGYDDDDDLVGFDDEDLIFGEDEDLIGFDDDDLIYGDDDDLGDLLGVMGGDDDDDDEIGAGRKRRRRRKALRRKRRRNLLRKKLAAKRKRSKVVATVARGRGLPFGAKATNPGSAGPLTLTARVQETLKPTNLIITGTDPSITTGSPIIDPLTYEILDIKVGTKSQSAVNGGVGGELFTPNSNLQQNGWDFDIVNAGTDLSVTISNTGAGTIWRMSGTGIVV